MALRAKLEPCTFTPAAKANPDVDDENDDGVVIADSVVVVEDGDDDDDT